MNKTYDEGINLVNTILEETKDQDLGNKTIIFAPPFTHLKAINDIVAGSGSTHFASAAQDCYWEEEGPYTGELSASILKSTGITFIITGHSERREHFGETNEIVKKKVDAILQSGLNPIFCCGEKEEARKNDTHFDLVEQQLSDSLYHLSDQDIVNVIIAYEPVWAIGTGNTATPEQAQEMHSFIRSKLTDKYTEEVAENISILYGGSCNPSNAAALFSLEDVDGGLIGGASLKAEDFSKLIEIL